MDTPQVKIGQPAIISSEGLVGQEFKWRVIKIAPQAEIKKYTTIVKVTLAWIRQRVLR